MKRVSVLLLWLAATTSCGSNSSIGHQEVKNAPRNDSELGLIATNVTSAQHTEIMLNHPAALFRNHGQGFAYEYRGLSKEEVLEFAPTATVEPNVFLQKQSMDNISDPLEFLALNPDAEFAPENCIQNPMLTTPSIRAENPSESAVRPIPETGQRLGFKHSKAPTDKALTAWTVLPPPGSRVESQLLSGPSIAFTADMAGVHSVVLFYKKNGQCNFNRFDFFVTDNTPYEPEFSKDENLQLDALSQRVFYQTTATGADKAQKQLKKLDFKTIRVAVLDSGVNYNSPALKNRMWTNTDEIPNDNLDNDQNGLIDDYVGYDFVNDDSHPMDDFGHGSHVAGLVAGEFMGTSADNVAIMALKVGGSSGLDLGSLISGILYAIEKKAQIINLSLSTTKPLPTLKAALQKAHEQGVLVVAASGNGDQFGEGINNDLKPHYPASYEFSNILAVASVRTDDALAVYSNYGLKSVDVATVGGFGLEGPTGLLSSVYVPNPSGILTQARMGTSMAAPVATGIAGLLMSAESNLTPEEVIEVLMSSSKKAPDLSSKIKSGARLDADAALKTVLNRNSN